MIYNKTVHDYFFLPEHVGLIDLSHDLVVTFKSNDKIQGIVELYMQCDEDKIIHKVCFKTNGNPYLIAGLEWACRQLEGISISKVSPIDYQTMINQLAIPAAQYPVALRIANIFKEILILMNSKLVSKGQHS